jgi:riboflavin kinase/FMN adenylyltransferase
MQITRLPDAEPRSRRVAVGEFDGVHLGHRQVIQGSDTVLTFDPHPLQVVRPEAAPKLLTSLDAKAELIEALGVQELVVIPFDERFAQQSPQEFIDHVLVERVGAERVSVGENFRFGRRAAGDPEMLQADGRFETRVVPLVEVEGEVVSSSHIRGLVLAGEVEVASRFLGSPFELRGEVVQGDRRGRTLGFPTANIVPDEALVCPGHGVYAARADGACAAVSVGVRPTFGTGRAVLVEAYLIDREVDLYGRRLAVQFIQRLRGERRFESAEALVEQMRADVQSTREVFRGTSARG